MKALVTLLYLAVLYGACAAGVMLLKPPPPNTPDTFRRETRLPMMTLTLLVVIAVFTGFQLFFPSLLPALERDAVRIRAGEWWRLVTPLFVQDGGLQGGVFNLVSLLLMGSVAERLWGSRRWLFIFFACGILSEALACAWQPVGAGNSVANFGLAASVAVRCLTRTAVWTIHLAAAVCLLAGVVLFLLKDIHGIAVALGAFTGLFLSWWEARTINHAPKPE